MHTHALYVLSIDVCICVPNHLMYWCHLGAGFCPFVQKRRHFNLGGSQLGPWPILHSQPHTGLLLLSGKSSGFLRGGKGTAIESFPEKIGGS